MQLEMIRENQLISVGDQCNSSIEHVFIPADHQFDRMEKNTNKNSIRHSILTCLHHRHWNIARYMLWLLIINLCHSWKCRTVHWWVHHISCWLPWHWNIGRIRMVWVMWMAHHTWVTGMICIIRMIVMIWVMWRRHKLTCIVIAWCVFRRYKNPNRHY